MVAGYENLWELACFYDKSQVLYWICRKFWLRPKKVSKPQNSFIVNVWQGPKHAFEFAPVTYLQTNHVYFTLKWLGNVRFHVVSTWNTCGVFAYFIWREVFNWRNDRHSFAKKNVSFLLHEVIFWWGRSWSSIWYD